MRLVSRRVATAGIAGAITAVALSVPELWGVSFLGLVTFLHTLTREPVTLKQAALLGGAGGLFFYLGSLWWFWNVLPLTWLGIESSSLSIVIVFTSWFVTSAALSLGWVFFALVAARFYRKVWSDLLLLPSLWVVGEVLSAWMYTLVNVGPGMLLGSHFSLSYLGYVVAGNEALLQLASVGGVYLLSFFFVLVASVIVVVIQTKAFKERVAILLGVGLLVVGAWAFGFSQAQVQGEVGGAQIVAISTHTSQRENGIAPEIEQERRVNALHLYLSSELKEGDEILVLPESTRYTQRARNVHRSDWQTRLYDELPAGLLVVDSATERDQDGILHSEIQIAGVDTFEHKYKRFLLPYGEYMPYLYRGFLTVLGMGEDLSRLDRGRAMHSGDVPTVFLVEKYALGTLVCSEIMSPSLAREVVREGGGVLLGLSSYLWFNEWDTIEKRMATIARVRAVETGTWFVQASDDAKALILNSKGQVVAETDPAKEIDHVRTAVPRQNEDTHFLVIGEWWIIGFTLISIVILGVRSRKNCIKVL